MTSKPIRISLVTPTRNEGPFLLEWIAWHRMLGFDDILVLSNDCTDGSDRLLDALAAQGAIRHLPHTPARGTSPLRSAYAHAFADDTLRAADWVMALDIDEYLQVFVGDGSIHDLMALNAGNYLGMAIYWKVFGSNDIPGWQDEFLRRRYTRAADGQVRANMHFKSVFRHLRDFSSMASHSPLGFKDAWGGNNIWVDCNGRPLRAIHLQHPPTHGRATAMRRITHKSAQINHYAVKSHEEFARKKTRQSGAAMVFRHTDGFFQKYDTNNITDTSALSRDEAFEHEYTRLTRDPDILAMHHACCAHYVKSLVEGTGTLPGDDARFRHHKALAGNRFP